MINKKFWVDARFFFFFTAFRAALGPIQPLIQWVPEAFPTGVNPQNSPPSSAEVELYLHSIVCFHGIVLN
jgi:hypothetical protein